MITTNALQLLTDALDGGIDYNRMDEDAHFDLLRMCNTAEARAQWIAGDTWNSLTRQYGDYASPEAKQQLKDRTGYTYNTLRAYGTVAKRFEPDTRISDVPFSFHQVAAALPSGSAEHVLQRVEAGELRTRDDVQNAVRAERRTIDAAVRQAQSVLEVPPDLPWTVEQHDIRRNGIPLYDSYVDLIVTSPPYGVDIVYEHDDIAADEWHGFMDVWLTDAYRVARPSGRLALNVPLDTTRGGFRPTYAQTVDSATRAGWTYRSSIVWLDDQLGKSVARGSHAAPSIIAPVEMVALFSKGEWKRESTRRSTLEHEQWLEWTNGVWRFPGETRAWEGHPAPFPIELPRRLIALLSCEGDTVLDPFCGSGTTLLAAVQQHREAIGFDISETYVNSARRRLAR